MITTPDEYLKLLHLVQDGNPPTVAKLLPPREDFITIDLDTRKINGPQFLSVETDHRSETLYFKVNRYFDNVDLSTMSCIVQFINAAGESGIYFVPYYDLKTETVGEDIENHKIIFPWVIEGAVTNTAGKVTYAVQFFKVAEGYLKYTYNLNTLPTTGEVLVGNKFDETAAADKIAEDLGGGLEVFLKNHTITEADLQQAHLTGQAILDLKYANSNIVPAYGLLVDKMNQIKDHLDIYWIDMF